MSKPTLIAEFDCNVWHHKRARIFRYGGDDFHLEALESDANDGDRWVAIDTVDNGEFLETFTVELCQGRVKFSDEALEKMGLVKKQELEEILAPIHDWYDGDGERTDTKEMLKDAIADYIKIAQRYLKIEAKNND